MKCPICGKEMLEGVLGIEKKAGGVIHFRLAKWYLLMRRLILRHAIVDERPDAESGYCPDCRIVLTRPDPEDAAHYNDAIRAQNGTNDSEEETI